MLPSYLIRFNIFGMPTTLLEMLIYISAIVCLVLSIKYKVLSKNIRIIHNTKYLLPILLFLIAGIISVIIAPGKREALGLFKAYIFDSILLFFVMIISANIIKDKQKLTEYVVKSLIISAAVVALYTIYQKITGQVTLDGRVVGIFGYSPNYLAMFLVPIIVLLCGYEHYLINIKNYKIEKIWYWDLSFLLILLAIWLTDSRASLVAVVFGIASFFIIICWQKFKLKKLILLFFGLLLILFLYFGWMLVKPNWQATPDSGRISSSNNIRWEIWQTTVKEILPNNDNWLLGVGLGNFQNYFTNLGKNKVNYPEYISPYALTPHNLFLNIWVNLGLLGLISFIWLLIIFFKVLIKNNLLIKSLLVSVMIAIIIEGLVDSPYWKNDLAVLFWLILALAVVKNNLVDNNEKI